MKKDKLKPCQFQYCKNKKIVILKDNKGYHVFCQSCGARTRSYENKEDAVDCWNN